VSCPSLLQALPALLPGTKRGGGLRHVLQADGLHLDGDQLGGGGAEGGDGCWGSGDGGPRAGAPLQPAAGVLIVGTPAVALRGACSSWRRRLTPAAG